eukprot:3881009-Rhodomonas_salina.4
MCLATPNAVALSGHLSHALGCSLLTSGLAVFAHPDVECGNARVGIALRSGTRSRGWPTASSTASQVTRPSACARAAPPRNRCQATLASA